MNSSVKPLVRHSSNGRRTPTHLLFQKVVAAEHVNRLSYLVLALLCMILTVNGRWGRYLTVTLAKNSKKLFENVAVYGSCPCNGMNHYDVVHVPSEKQRLTNSTKQAFSHKKRELHRDTSPSGLFSQGRQLRNTNNVKLLA